jgi:hypothetical protein
LVHPEPGRGARFVLGIAQRRARRAPAQPADGPMALPRPAGDHADERTPSPAAACRAARFHASMEATTVTVGERTVLAGQALAWS